MIKTPAPLRSTNFAVFGGGATAEAMAADFPVALEAGGLATRTEKSPTLATPVDFVSATQFAIVGRSCSVELK
jgi:hypothetical protein